MSAQTKIVLNHNGEANHTIVDIMSPTDCGSGVIHKLVNFLRGAMIGARSVSAIISVNDGTAVAASGTVTLSSLANNDTITVAGVVFTAKTSGASGAAQFNLGANDTAAASAAAVIMNANTSLTNVVTASAASGVITITAVNAGQAGNQLGIAISAHGSVSGSGKLTSGAEPVTLSAAATYKLHI